MPQLAYRFRFPIDHIIAQQHGGPSTEDNLALACFFCNSAKGPNLAGLDPETGRLVPLFHPRRQKWSRHFRLAGPMLVGRTPCGRATVAVLAMNLPDRVDVRAQLLAAGLFHVP